METANKLSTNTAGDNKTPVYFANGVPTALKYTIEKSVPSNAVFTDTVYTHPSYTAKSSGLYKITVNSTGHVSATTGVSKADITSLGIASDSVMSGATSSAAGTKGLVPAPAAGNQSKFLRGDGTWATPTDTNTDTKVNVTLGTTTKAYLLGTSTTPTNKATGVTAISDTGVYLDTTAGQLVANTFKGNLSGTATKATQDSAGQQINTTYIKGLSVSGKTITYTKGDGTTGTITTQDTDTTYPDATQSTHGLMSTTDKKKLDGIATGAEVNQNAFSNIVVGSTTIAADTKTDSLTFAAGSNVTITPDATNDKITIAAKDTTYSIFGAATSSAAGTKGLVPAPTAGANTKFLRGDGTWQTIDTGTIVSGSTTATARASVITNPLSVAISDAAQIYQNGILLTKNTHYTINSAGNIALNGYTADEGDIFTVVSKSTGVDVSLNAAAANIGLVNSAGYFDSVNNVESAIAKIGQKLNGGVVAGVRVNGTVATPDSNGVVDVASPTIKVNGNVVSADTNGVVNITNIVKTTGATMTGNLIAKSTSTGNHVRNISVYASDATLPTTGNDGDIILVYSNS